MFTGKARICRTCEAKGRTHRCEACGRQLRESDFDKTLLDNARKHQRRRVCLQCQGRGFSPKDVGTYNCHFCGKLGHLKFAPKEVQKVKKRNAGALICTDCAGRRRRLEATLRKKEAFKCSCPGPARSRVHNATNERCTLFPRRFGEQRWAGSNLGVTRADLDFLQAYKAFEEHSA